MRLIAFLFLNKSSISKTKRNQKIKIEFTDPNDYINEYSSAFRSKGHRFQRMHNHQVAVKSHGHQCQTGDENNHLKQRNVNQFIYEIMKKSSVGAIRLHVTKKSPICTEFSPKSRENDWI